MQFVEQPHQYSLRVSIPQAVGTVATVVKYYRSIGFKEVVSIPQAVGTVATGLISAVLILFRTAFQYRKR